MPDAFKGRRAALHTPLVADPGTAWKYGINTDWLGQVVEAVSGQDLAAHLAEHVFGPLKMQDTTFRPSPDQRARLMAIHARAPAGGRARSRVNAPIPDPNSGRPATAPTAPPLTMPGSWPRCWAMASWTAPASCAPRRWS